MATKTHNRLPSDFPYAPGQVLPGGAQFHVLPTLDQLVTFWKKQRRVLPYAVCSTSEDSDDENWFLEPYEWIFAPTPSAVIRAVLRWDRYEIRPTWHDWARHCPEEHAAYFHERAQRRKRQMAAGVWTCEQELEFQSDPRTPETYRGWWELTNLPNMLTTEQVFGWFPEEIFDPGLSVKQVEGQFQLQMFEAYKGSNSCDDDVRTFDRSDLDRYIQYWVEDRERGEDYYGSGNALETRQPQDARLSTTRRFLVRRYIREASVRRSVRVPCALASGPISRIQQPYDPRVLPYGQCGDV